MLLSLHDPWEYNLVIHCIVSYYELVFQVLMIMMIGVIKKRNFKDKHIKENHMTTSYYM